jgi:hypothetical protein
MRQVEKVDVGYGEIAADINELIGMNGAAVRGERSSKSRESNYSHTSSSGLRCYVSVTPREDALSVT